MLWGLAGVEDGNPRQGGYGFGVAIDNGAFHPGIDLNAGVGANADCGNALEAISDLELVWEGWSASDSGKGFGWHCWWQDLRTGDYPHYCHALEEIAIRSHGARIARGFPFGKCGGTAGWVCHLHLEIWAGPAAPPLWDFWPTPYWASTVAGRTLGPYSPELLAWVRERYRDPAQYLRDRQAEHDGAGAPAPVETLPAAGTPPEEVWRMALTPQQIETLARRSFGKYPFVTGYRAGHGIPVAWVEEAQKPGGYLGRPRTAELPIADGSGGTMQEFERGWITWDPERGVTVLR